MAMGARCPHNERMRCERHGLACGPDGGCVLCRRAVAPAGAGGRPVAIGVAAAGVIVAAGVAYRLSPRAGGISARDLEAVQPNATPVAVQSFVAASAPAAPPPMPSAIEAARERELRTLQALAYPSAPPARSSAPDAPAKSAVDAKIPESAAPAPRTDVHVVVYTTSWCPVCKRAKRWMASSGISYEERDIDASLSNAERARALNPAGSVPTFDVGGEVLVGFSPESLTATIRRAEAANSAREPW